MSIATEPPATAISLAIQLEHEMERAGFSRWELAGVADRKLVTALQNALAAQAKQLATMQGALNKIANGMPQSFHRSEQAAMIACAKVALSQTTTPDYVPRAVLENALTNELEKAREELDQSPSDPIPVGGTCQISGGSSRICELGTKACIVRHKPTPNAEEGFEEWINQNYSQVPPNIKAMCIKVWLAALAWKEKQ